MSCGPDQHDDLTLATGPRLAGTSAALWRSLDELQGTPEFEGYLHREFPKAAGEWSDPVSRRNFLRLMGASLALAGVGSAGGCGRSDEQLIPYVVPPEQLVPGKPLQFATTMPFLGFGVGALAESHMGRPTKLEGNPDHPASRGGSHAYMQASVLGLYDPDRAQTITTRGQVGTWTEFLIAIRNALAAQRATGGAGVRILTETVTSPTLVRQIGELLGEYPQARWHHYEPVGKDNAREGARLAFGRAVNVVHRFDKATRILSLDSDFLLTDPAAIRNNREFSDARRVRFTGAGGHDHPRAEMHRTYVVESMPTITGAMADHRVAIPAGLVEGFARAVLQELGGQGGASGHPQADVVRKVVADLSANRGTSLVVVGDGQPPIVHALGAAMNERLGAVGQTVVYTDPVEAEPDSGIASLRLLVDDMTAGRVDLLVILGANPVYTAPVDLNFTEALTKVALRVHHSPYYDETGFRCDWHIPESHYLESWGDLRATDGTASIVQPLIHPLYQSRSAHELLDALVGTGQENPREIVKATWRDRAPAGQDFETWWRTVLEKGVVPGTALPPVQVSLVVDPLALPRPSDGAAGMELVFRPDPNLYDGRFANNGWLQELPKPLTKLTWDNVAHMSRATAVKLGLASSPAAASEANGKVVTLRFRGREQALPAYVVPGHADDSITVHLGFGRTVRGMRVASGAGRDVYTIRPSDAMSFGRGLEVIPTGEAYPLACTQPHQMIEGRDILKVHALEAFKAETARENGHDDHGAAHGGHHDGAAHGGKKLSLSLYPSMPGSDPANTPTGHAWAMSIDANVCTGCNACVVACQSENNIPVVGKEQVLAQREMHWLRIDTYYKGEPDAPEGPFFEPMLCQHCENAPCEYVCPVNATTHSSEGINEMTYNRCIGTRYCSNNCPYKVRRFNFLKYQDRETPVLKLMFNPDVTIRPRGVMEKCTFCVQRVNGTRRELKILKGEQTNATKTGDAAGAKQAQAKWDELLDSLQTACQQACPTRAIVFGDLNQPGHEVKHLRDEPHAFGILTELNTAPRVTYLARFTNPNPEMT